MLARLWDPSSHPPVTMRTWTEIQHQQPARPYLGLSHLVEATATGVGEPASDVVGQLPGGHLAAEVGVLGDQGGTGVAATEDDGGGADLGEEESVEEGRETNRGRWTERK